MIAVLLGLYFSARFASLGSNVTGSLSYALTFALYGIMITSGLVVHCIYLVECGGEPASQVCVCVCVCGWRRTILSGVCVCVCVCGGEPSSQVCVCGWRGTSLSGVCVCVEGNQPLRCVCVSSFLYSILYFYVFFVQREAPRERGCKAIV